MGISDWLYVKCSVLFAYRSQNGPVLIASPAGGMDIEDVAEKSPELIKKIPIDIFEGISDKVALDVAKFLNFNGPLASVVSIILLILKYQLFIIHLTFFHRQQMK